MSTVVAGDSKWLWMGMATMYENVCGNSIELAVHSRAILKIVKSMCNDSVCFKKFVVK
jgi:hypothetical protein